ncbi:hypothetical protein HN51_005777 [Arachis hypogaea]|nr:Sucrose transport protein [Arachis hypogaea]
MLLKIFWTMKGLKKPMLRLMAVVTFNWVALFGFFWYISDWMGSEVYGGEDKKLYSFAIPLYTIGYWYGVQCLMLTWAVTGLMSLAVESIGRAGNFILASGLAMTLYISKLAKDERLERNDLTFTRDPSNDIRDWVLRFFGVLGIPLAITLSVALALASIYSNESGAGKGMILIVNDTLQIILY